MKMPDNKQIPEFDAEDEEREFWASHDSTEYVDWTTASRPQLLDLQRKSTIRGRSPSLERPTGINFEGLLSARQLEVLALLAEGVGNREIAEELSISPSTVYRHLKHIQEKLKTTNRTQTVLLARTLLGQSQP